jgi:osmotically-inducible protein OsmY
MSTKPNTFTLSVMGALLASATLVGCDRASESSQAAKHADAVVAQSDQNSTAPATRNPGVTTTPGATTPSDSTQAGNGSASTDVPADTRSDAARAKDSIGDTARDVKNATESAAKDAKDKVSDAVITTSVKAQLATDKSLSATKVNVDTDGGKVALRGTAPSAEAKAHATELAYAVKGVITVDNQLTIESANM